MTGLLIWAIGTALVILPLWKLCARAGLPPALSLISVMPVFGVILLWILVLRPWPGDPGYEGN